jgi:hypothetical protein
MCDAFRLLHNDTQEDLITQQETGTALNSLRQSCGILRENMNWLLFPIVKYTLELTIKSVDEYIRGNERNPYANSARDVLVQCQYILASDEIFNVIANIDL